MLQLCQMSSLINFHTAVVHALYFKLLGYVFICYLTSEPFISSDYGLKINRLRLIDRADSSCTCVGVCQSPVDQCGWPGGVESVQQLTSHLCRAHHQASLDGMWLICLQNSSSRYRLQCSIFVCGAESTMLGPTHQVLNNAPQTSTTWTRKRWGN